MVKTKTNFGLYLTYEGNVSTQKRHKLFELFFKYEAHSKKISCSNFFKGTMPLIYIVLFLPK